MDWTILWMMIALAISFAVGWLIRRYSLGELIKNIIKNYDEIKPALVKVVDTVVDAFREDSPGGHTPTPEEITAVKEALKDLLALFGVDVPFVKSLMKKLE